MVVVIMFYYEIEDVGVMLKVGLNLFDVFICVGIK